MMQLTEEQRKELLAEIDYNRKNCFLSDKTELLMQIAEAALTEKPDESDLAGRHTEWLNTLQRPMFSDEDWEELTLYTWLAFRDSYRIHRARNTAIEKVSR